MDRRALLAAGAAVVGLLAVLVGVRQELLHVGAAHAGTVDTGWTGSLNHSERLLTRLAGLGAAGAVVAYRWRRVAVLPAATGGVVLYYALRAVLGYALDPGLYTEVTLWSGRTTAYVLGAEPFLLAAGGLLLVASGLVGYGTGGDSERRRRADESAA